MESLKVITIDNTCYLGEIKDNKIINAFDCGKKVSSEDLIEWLKVQNLKELETIEIKGTVSYRSKELDAHLKRKLVSFIAEFDEIKKQARALLENSYFNPEN